MKYLNLIPELELQLEIDRLSIQNFVKNTFPSSINYLIESINIQTDSEHIQKDIFINKNEKEGDKKNNLNKDENIKFGLEKSSILGSLTNIGQSNRTDGSEKSSISLNQKKIK